MEKEANDGIKYLISIPSDPLLPCLFMWDKCDLAHSDLIAPINNDSAIWLPTFPWGDPERNVTFQREWAESTTVSCAVDVCCSQ